MAFLKETYASLNLIVGNPITLIIAIVIPMVTVGILFLRNTFCPNESTSSNKHFEMDEKIENRIGTLKITII